MSRRVAVVFVLCASCVIGGGAQSIRKPFALPAPPGFQTLAADLHLHTVFSDGEVWPTVHVREAWRDGLDLVALTDHLEYRPHARDVAGSALRAFEVARPLADQLGLLLLPAAEITRPIPLAPSPWPVGSAHFNALFITDDTPLANPDLTAALRAARTQGAFVFWNHPSFMGRRAQWFPHVAELFDQGLFQGIEVVNGDDYSPEAFEWALARRLTILACSDAHLPMPAHLRSARRPMTMLFVRTRDLDGIRDALVSRRTVAWLDNDVWGEEQWLRALWNGAVRAAAMVTVRAGSELMIPLENLTSIDFDLEVLSPPTWLTDTTVRVPRSATVMLRGRMAGDVAAGAQELRLDVRIRNLHTRPDEALRAQLAFPVHVER
jgi:3',5'-nucleoside bisphosphate phosphatase